MLRGVKMPRLCVSALLVLALVRESFLIKNGPLRWLHWCWAPGFWKALKHSKSPYVGASWGGSGREARCRDPLVWVCGSHLRPEAWRAGSAQVPQERRALPRGQGRCLVLPAQHCLLLLCQVSDQAVSTLYPHPEKGLIFISKMPEMHQCNSKRFH